MKLKGLNPPVITIFKENGEINYEAMFCHADYLISHGVDGLAYLGTSGEFGVMTQKQKLELISKITKYVGGRVQVLIGIGDTCLENTLEMADCAREAGADGLLAVIPYFSIYGEKNVEAYYHALAQKVSLPLILYNFPALTGFDLNPELVMRLALSEPNILGVKDTVPQEGHLRDMMKIKEKKPEFSVFCAYESQALTMAKAGIDGYINATGNFAPQFTAALLEARRAGDESNMAAAAEKMCMASKVYQYGEPLLLAVKEAVYQLLNIEAFERLPGLPLDDAGKEAVSRILKELVIVS